MIVVCSAPVSGGTDSSNTTITLSAFSLRNGATVMGGVKFEGAVTTVDRITDTAGNRYFWSPVSVANNSDINAFCYWAENCKAHPANVVTIVLAASRPFYRGFAMSGCSDAGGTVKFSNFSASWISSGANPSTGPVKVNGPAMLVAVLSEYTTSTWTVPADAGASAVTQNGSTGFYYRIPLGSGGWTASVTSSDSSTHKGVAAATFSEEFAPSDWDTPDAVAGGGTSAAIGLASETDTAQLLGRSKSKAIALASETDVAQTFGRTKIRAIAPASETDLAQVFGRAKSKAIALAAETDEAQLLGRSKSKAIALATETDSAQALGRVKQKAINFAEETDLAQPLGTGGAVAISPALETDLAQAFGRFKSKAIAFAEETDLAQVVGRVKARSIGFGDETDLAQALGRLKSKAIGFAGEVDEAQAFAVAGVKTAAIGRAEETDIALPFGAILGSSLLGPRGGIGYPYRKVRLRREPTLEQIIRRAIEEAVEEAPPEVVEEVKEEVREALKAPPAPFEATKLLGQLSRIRQLVQKRAKSIYDDDEDFMMLL